MILYMTGSKLVPCGFLTVPLGRVAGLTSLATGRKEDEASPCRSRLDAEDKDEGRLDGKEGGMR